MRRCGDAETRRCSWRYKFPRKPKETPSFWTRTLIFYLHNNVILNVDKHLFELHGHRFPQSEKVWVIISVWQKLCATCNQSHSWSHATCHPCNLSCDWLHSYSEDKICQTEIIVKNAEMRRRSRWHWYKRKPKEKIVFWTEGFMLHICNNHMCNVP